MNVTSTNSQSWSRAVFGLSSRLGLLVAALAAACLLLAGRAHAADAAPVQRTAFDHLTTGFELVGQHRDLPCESCHVNAIFKGTPRDCAACHGVGTAVRATAKPVTHILTSNICSACHTPVGWSPAVNFDHAEVMGGCYTCHNGVQAQGKGLNHIYTTKDCGVCHSTIGWGGAVFNHVGTTTGCATCHNGLGATGQPANHIPTIPAGDGTCEGCHSATNYTTWKDVTSTADIHMTAAGWACAGCHETAAFLGMTPSTASAAHDSRPPTALDANHPGVAAGDCGVCHDTISFTAVTSLRPANHIPTNAPCLQCHTTPGKYAQYSVTGTHIGVTECLSCHGPTAGPFANVTIVNAASTNHIPIGSLDCNGSGCHATTNVNPGGFKINGGVGSIGSPTLTVAGHTTVGGQVPACTSCHETAVFQGMVAGTGTTAGDSRPTATLDAAHPVSGDCLRCHSTTPTFATNLSAGGGLPAGHIPTNAPCTQCHTTAGNFKVYSVTGTHIGVTECLSCHASSVATTFLGVTIVSTAANHIPIGSLDCSGSGCHTTTNVNPGGFVLGAGAAGNINNPTLNISGHTTVGAQVACTTCHETAAFQGMVAGTSTASDLRPSSALDAAHPSSGDCSQCHTTAPVFATNLTATAGLPAGHIPTNAPCAQCHTTAGNFKVYSVAGTHVGVSECLSCHASNVATTFLNVTMVSTAANHIPIGSMDCNGSGCHTTTNVNPGGFVLGAGTVGNINTPTLNIAGHSTVAAQVAACTTCHETAAFQGMVAAAGSASDLRPSTALDAAHPTTGDCAQCHTTTPVFATNLTGNVGLPAGHIPTKAPCTQCHTTVGNFKVYSVTGTHVGVTECLSCHAASVASTFLNVTITPLSPNHIPVGNLDCNGSGCHSTANVNPGGFKIGTGIGNINTPTLSVAGHATVAGVVPTCTTCHEAATFQGMVATTAVPPGGDSRPSTALDAIHPAAGDCGNCHTSAPTFTNNLLPANVPKPPNHIPTTATCGQCHTTAGNFKLYSLVGTHQGVTDCLSCHATNVGPFVGVTMVTAASTNHMPIGSLDCNGSGCHTTANVNPGGFLLGAANINAPTLNVAGHTTVAGQVPACTTCHETAAYKGMIATVNLTGGDSRPSTALDSLHPTGGDCSSSSCHTSTAPTFASNLGAGSKPANHIPTTAACTQCHTTPGNFKLYSVVGTHQGVTNCLSCHGTNVGPFVGVTMVTSASTNHIPFGSLDCNGSGCHSTGNVNAGGFKVGVASINAPTLNVAGHTTVAGQVPACTSCHETAAFTGMLATTALPGGDSRPSTALDKSHPTGGDCFSSNCHTTTAPTFGSNLGAGSKPSNHIPTTAACAQCHTTAGNFALYSLVGTHQGVANCLSCHGTAVGPFANVTMVTAASTNHFPFGNLDCNGSGCHSASNVNPGGFKLGTANINAPTLTVTGHTTVQGQVPACTTCHETAAFTGMVATTALPGGDSRPSTALDKAHPTSGDCAGTCHLTTAPTFGTNLGAGSKPSNHIPTTAACAQCHTTAGNFALYSVVGTHQGVTNCLSCHGPTVGPFANITMVTSASTNHFPFGNLDCNASGCHTTANVSAGGFKLGVANINAPTLTVTGHTTVQGQVPACTSCHETAAFTGMIASTASLAADSRPTALDKAHPTSGDCGGACHTTTAPTFSSNYSGTAKPPNHIPTNLACSVCHTTAGNFALAVMGTAGHQGITNGCKTCHSYGQTFAGVWTGGATGPVAPPAGPTGHIPTNPPNTSARDITCESCHNVSNFTSFAGTVMKHAFVTTMQCMACHELGMAWKTNTGVRLWQRASANHYPGIDCTTGCHEHSAQDRHVVRRVAAAGSAIERASSSAGGVAAVGGGALGRTGSFDHRRVAATACVSCHSATSGTGKPVDHIATSNNCVGCHSSVAWVPVTAMDHTQALGTCVSCHNGTVAKGKGKNHIASGNNCETCHTTNAWTPARFDHTGVVAGTCKTCHDGLRATGMPGNHVPTAAQCDTCHGTLGWKPAKLDHTKLISNCATCHNNAIALGVPPAHMAAKLDCATCHSYPDWTVLRFVHTSGRYPGSHKVALTCVSCHSTNTDQISWPAPAGAGSCAGCHTKDYVPVKHPKTVAGLLYTVSELGDCTGACHVYSDTTLKTVSKSQPGLYHRVLDAAFKH